MVRLLGKAALKIGFRRYLTETDFETCHVWQEEKIPKAKGNAMGNLTQQLKGKTREKSLKRMEVVEERRKGRGEREREMWILRMSNNSVGAMGNNKDLHTRIR